MVGLIVMPLFLLLPGFSSIIYSSARPIIGAIGFFRQI
jgi:hypothetical protein